MSEDIYLTREFFHKLHAALFCKIPKMDKKNLWSFVRLCPYASFLYFRHNSFNSKRYSYRRSIFSAKQFYQSIKPTSACNSQNTFLSTFLVKLFFRLVFYIYFFHI